MNLIINLKNFKLENVFFLDTKENIIMDGNFTKIIYSNEWYVMNGIYIELSLSSFYVEKIMNKDYLRFNPLFETNINIIKEISKLENKLLEYYKKIFNVNNKINLLLTRQLRIGNLKIFKEYTKMNQNQQLNHNNNKNYILKISGIWENYNEIGITYKLLEV
jgi:hypothetical protein